ncbi:hypothetical protein GOP47_0012107 [Adiantum capillus-veneris]|uniref:EF-hand domain-containing protein n=1 Tax=Adiantum capillus-veneris TaxID=13818 RepID=A0A9D4UQT4_ADICA|nr:hypothetical protein GOP47_0012107 [Adiantum capillus-veneris]
MEHWNYGSRASQQQGHSQAGQLGYPPGSFGGQQGAASVATPYSAQLFPQPSFGQAFGQQILGSGGKSGGADDFQGGAIGSSGLTGGNMSGLYGLDSKFPSSGFGSVGASPAAFNQKADQLGALGQYSKSQSQFLAADGHSDALKRYSESQLLQSALRQGAALEAGVRSQSEYLSGSRSSAITAAGGGAYGSGRELLGSTYGVTRSEAEAALLGSQVGLAARGGVGVLPFQSQAADSLGSLAGARGLLGAMYPPGAGYSSLDLASARSGISGMSDLAGIGGTRYDDRLDDRVALRFDYDRRDDDRRIRERSLERDRDRGRERERERSWERERERERLRERERARERERLRDRERAREREREREREQRRRERTPPRILPPPRRDEKAGKKFSPPPARSPIKPRKREYVCKVEPFSLVEKERDLLSLIRRYPRLYVAADFAKVVTCWKEEGLEIALNQPVSFEVDAVDAEEENDTKDAAVNCTEDADALKEGIVWSVKVMLMSGASGESVKDLLADCSNEEKPIHMHNLLRFVVFRKEHSALMAVGGVWDKTLDGGDPATGESALIRTAIRCTKDATQLDLTAVSSWKRIMEVHYDRVRDSSSTYKEVTVFLIPDLSGCLPTLDSWKLQWKQRREARLQREASEKQDKDGKSSGSPKDNQKKEKVEKVQDKDAEEKDSKKEEKSGRDAKKDDKKEKEAKEDKKDVKKEEKKEELLKKEEKREKDIKKDDKKDKDVKKEDKKEKHEEKKEKDAKKEDKKQKDRKVKEEKKDKDEKRDEEKKAEKKDDKDVKGAKGRGSDKKGKVLLEVEAPEVPGFFITSCTKAGKARAMTISLDGLLDYDERDKEESTFELSLFGEIFQEMLQYRYGSRVLEALESLHRSCLGRKKEDKKRGRHEKDAKSTTNKKSKFSDSATPGSNTEAVADKVSSEDAEVDKKDDPKPVKDIDAAMQEASLINFDELEEELQETPEVRDADVTDEDKPTQEANESKKSARNVIVNEKLLKAFRYFDKNRLNFLKAEDVRRLVHILGRCLTRRWVKDLSSTALSESRAKDDCIYYKKLAEKEVV